MSPFHGYRSNASPVERGCFNYCHRVSSAVRTNQLDIVWSGTPNFSVRVTRRGITSENKHFMGCQTRLDRNWKLTCKVERQKLRVFHQAKIGVGAQKKCITTKVR